LSTLDLLFRENWTMLKRGKDRLNDHQVTEVVYKINCNDCDKVYIGQTKRHLVTRIKEHRNNKYKESFK